MPAPVIETHHLALLVAIADEGTLHAAARRLHLSPSALSQQLRDLEDRLGGTLFHRQWRRLAITAAGQRATEAARALLAELARTEDEIRQLLVGGLGSIRITTACHQSYTWLGAALRAFATAFPSVDVTIIAEATADPCSWLVSRKLDVALMPTEIAHDRRIRIERLFRDELVALVGTGHPWVGRRRVPFAAFADQHVWSDAGAFRRGSLLARAFAAAGDVAPRKVTVVPVDAPVAVEMARANLGVTILPRWSVEPVLAGGGLHAVSLGSSGLWLNWAIATRAEPPEAPLAAFTAVLRAEHPRSNAAHASRSASKTERRHDRSKPFAT